MKKTVAILSLAASLIVLLMLVPRFEHADGDIAIDEINFSDSAFRRYVKKNFDTNTDGVLSEAEVMAVTVIDIPSGNIYDAVTLKGVALTYLRQSAGHTATRSSAEPARRSSLRWRRASGTSWWYS